MDATAISIKLVGKGQDEVDISKADSDLDLQALMNALSSNPNKVTYRDVHRMVDSRNALMVIALDPGGQAVGMGVLNVVDKLARREGFINEVVVLPTYRGTGLGYKITVKLIQLAREKGIVRIELTSNNQRERALALYEAIGFNRVPTNVLRLEPID